MKGCAVTVPFGKLVEIDSGVHKKRTGANQSVVVAQIFLFLVESFELNYKAAALDSKFNENGEHCLSLIFADELPRALVGVIPRGDYTVEVAVMNEVVILVLIGDLSLDLFARFFADVCRVKLVAERTPHCDIALCFIAGTPACGNMSALNGSRIAEG